MGIYQVVCSVFAVLLALTSSGLPIAVSKQTARLRALRDYDGGHATTAAGAVIGLSIALVITLAIVIFRRPISTLFVDKRCMPIFMVLLPGVAASAIYSSYRGGLWGQKNFFAYALCEFIEEALLIGTGIILVSRASGVTGGAYNAAISVSISFVAAALITVCIYFYYDGKIKSPKGYYLPVLQSAAPLTGIRIASSVITSLLALIIPIRLKLSGLSASEALSEFGIASGMTLPLLFIPGTVVGALALVLIPEISGSKDKAEVARQVEGALCFSIFASLVMVIPYTVAGREIGVLLYSNERSGELLTYSAAIMIPMSLSNMASSLLNTLGKEVYSLRHYLIGAALMMATIWFLPPLLGIYSMIFGFFLSFSVTATLNTLAVAKSVGKMEMFWRDGARMLLACTGCTAAAWIANLGLKQVLPQPAAAFICAAAGSALFIAVCFKLRIANMDTQVKKILTKRFNKKEKVVYN
jgi:stage V sporulation protein B